MCVAAGKWLFVMLTLCCSNTFTPLHLLLNATDRIVLCIKRSTASGDVCAAIISPDDLAFVLKVSEAVVAQSIFCAGIHLTA